MPSSSYPGPGGGGERPPVPNQWLPVYSDQLQRWYFVETTGRAQWDAPVYVPPQPPMPAYGDYAGGSGTRGADYSSGGGYGAPPSGPPPSGSYGGGYNDGDRGALQQQQPPKENHDKRNMLMGAAAGLAVGAVGAAVVAEALSDSDDDEHRAAPPPQEYSAPPPPPPSGPVDAWGNPISEDDRESVASAREEYQEQLEDSSASSSDVEEAREEYLEELEEAYYDE